MNKFGKTLFVGLLSTAIFSQAATAMADQKRRDHRSYKHKGEYKWCDRDAKVRIRDLDARPRHFFDGQPLHKWYVDAYLDSKNRCKANVSIWEGHDLVARERHYNLQPGRNRIELEPEHRYRFNKHEHCFDVYFNLKGNRRKIDADRTFCARQIRAWTLDEGRDHHRHGHRR